MQQKITARVSLTIHFPSEKLAIDAIQVTEPENREAESWLKIMTQHDKQNVTWILTGNVKLSTLRSSIDSLLHDLILFTRIHDSLTPLENSM